jgi:hypothetical protein
MKRLRSISFILSISFLLAFQCSRRDCCGMPPCSESHTLQGSWQFTGYRNEANGDFEGNPGVDGQSVIYTFTDNGKEGKIEGKTFSNTVSGTYTLEDFCTYKIKEFGGTKVGEPEWSSRAWLVSGTSERYQRVNNQLVLYRNNGTVAMIFKKVD